MKDNNLYEKEIKFFSRAIKVKRFELNLTQEELAEITNFHPNAIGRLERGDAVPSYITIIKLARALKISPKELVPD